LQVQLLRKHARRIADGRLAIRGRLLHEWALRRMGIVEKIRVKNERAQPLAAWHVAKNYNKMERKVHCLPEKIDGQVARYALDVMVIRIDEMTKEQKYYQASS